MIELTDSQKDYLEYLGKLRETAANCGHESCRDNYTLTEMEMAAELERYGVTGLQFAVIAMDLINLFDLAGLLGDELHDKVVQRARGLCGIAYRLWKDGQDDG